MTAIQKVPGTYWTLPNFSQCSNALSSMRGTGGRGRRDRRKGT